MLWDKKNCNFSFKIYGDNYFSFYPETDNMFDIYMNGKSVKLSLFLKITNFNQLKDIMNSLHSYKILVIENDINFLNYNIIIEKYIKKRIGQIYLFLCESLPDTQIYFN